MPTIDLRAADALARPSDTTTITRVTRFDGLDTAYDDRVLEPRPWTVLQSAWAADLAAVVPDGPILELCSGAGHIGLAAAVRCGRDLVQIDANPVACLYAAANARAAARLPAPRGPTSRYACSGLRTAACSCATARS